MPWLPQRFAVAQESDWFSFTASVARTESGPACLYIGFEFLDKRFHISILGPSGGVIRSHSSVQFCKQLRNASAAARSLSSQHAADDQFCGLLAYLARVCGSMALKEAELLS